MRLSETVGYENGASLAPTYIDLAVVPQGEHKFYTGLDSSISNGGIFVATYDLRPIGSPVVVRAKLATGQKIVIHGRIAWLRLYNPLVNDLPPGIGVRFDHLDKPTLNHIEHYLLLDPAEYCEGVDFACSEQIPTPINNISLDATQTQFPPSSCHPTAMIERICEEALDQLHSEPIDPIEELEGAGSFTRIGLDVCSHLLQIAEPMQENTRDNQDSSAPDTNTFVPSSLPLTDMKISVVGVQPESKRQFGGGFTPKDTGARLFVRTERDWIIGSRISLSLQTEEKVTLRLIGTVRWFRKRKASFTSLSAPPGIGIALDKSSTLLLGHQDNDRCWLLCKVL